MLQKQKIILKHIDGMSNRAIARELHVSKDTVNKYVKEYQNQRSELIQTIVEKPKYNSGGRRPTKVTHEMMNEIEALLELNRMNPHLPMFESCAALEYRVDKYSTVVISQNHYSVPDTLVGKMLLVKTYTDKIVIYHEKTIVSVHERNYLNHSWNIKLKHYLKTLYKKPGALHKSTALLQEDTKIQNIFMKYYSRDAKTFLEVLEVVYEKGVDAVTDALRELERISPLDMSRDKVKAICDHTEQTKCNAKKNYTNALSGESRTSLSLYNKLANLQLERVI